MVWKLTATYTDPNGKEYSRDYINVSDIDTKNMTEFVPFEVNSKFFLDRNIEKIGLGIKIINLLNYIITKIYLYNYFQKVIPALLVGNKSDLPRHEDVTEEKLK